MAEDGSGVGLVYRGSLIYRKAADGSLTLEGASMPEGRLTVNGVRWYVKDHLGSVRAVVDGFTGGLLAVTDYEAYGEDMANATASSYLSPAPAGETFRDHFTGKEDQGPDFGTAYTDFGARQYSPALRRWLVPDPLSEKYYGVSPYAYCAGDPVNMVDEDGREGIKHIDDRGRKEIVSNIVMILEPPQIVPDDASTRTRNRIERRNEQIRRENNERIESAKALLDRVYNGEEGGSYNSSGELVHFEFNIIGVECSESDINKPLSRKLAFENGLPGESMGFDVIARAPVVHYGQIPGAYGEHKGNSITLLPGAPEITLAHEIGHSLGVHDMPNSGGVMDNRFPSYYLSPLQVDIMWQQAFNQR